MPPEHLNTLWVTVDLSAAVVFAITGALVASRKQMDVIAFMWLGVVTGIGGGTVRDLLLGVPVFWVRDASPVIACLTASVFVHFTAHLVLSRYRLLLWLDALGLALVTIAGTAKGLDAGAGPVVAVVMGVITAAVGGIIRDIIGQEPSIILKREIYVTASVAGAVVYVLAMGAGVAKISAVLVGFTVAFGVRAFAIWFGWTLPAYRARAGRTLEDRQAGLKSAPVPFKTWCLKTLAIEDFGKRQPRKPPVHGLSDPRWYPQDLPRRGRSGERRVADNPERIVHGAAWPLGLREIHAAAHDCRP
jgi:uncharacterized membrane protein YeiH